jgi:hypothetical protein
MDPVRFDRWTKLLTTRWTRRRAIAAGSAGIAATTLLATGRGPAIAQEATPSASPVATPAFPADPHPSADNVTTDPEYLFVQPFDAGTWAPKAGADGVYLLTLTGVAADTTYFSDRPARDTGLAETQAFLDGLGFGVANPPNAAIVAQTASGEQDVLVIELMNPVYEADAATLTYEAKILPNYGKRGLAHLAQQQVDYELAPSFGEGSLFIDDCPDIIESCFSQESNPGCISINYIGNQTVGQCWQDLTCKATNCTETNSQCDISFPDSCDDEAQEICWDDIALCGAPACCAGKGGCNCSDLGPH